MRSEATTVEQYLDELPAERREALEAVRAVILKNLPKGYEEGMQYGMIGYFVPHSIYPDGYHCDPKQPLPFASIASQKNHMAVYLTGIYMDESERKKFETDYKSTRKRFDVGKSCVRFRKIENLPLLVIGDAIAVFGLDEFVEQFQKIYPGGRRR